MTYAMELEMTKREARMKGKQEGREEGMEQKKCELIVNLPKMNLAIDSIAKATDSTISYVKEAGREAVISV